MRRQERASTAAGRRKRLCAAAAPVEIRLDSVVYDSTASRIERTVEDREREDEREPWLKKAEKTFREERVRKKEG